MRCCYCNEDATYTVYTLVKSMAPRKKGDVVADIGEYADGVCGEHIAVAKRWKGFLRHREGTP